MNRIKKAVRILIFTMLILLAGIGVGLSGGVTIPSIKNRKNKANADTELLDHQDQKPDAPFDLK